MKRQSCKIKYDTPIHIALTVRLALAIILHIYYGNQTNHASRNPMFVWPCIIVFILFYFVCAFFGNFILNSASV